MNTALVWVLMMMPAGIHGSISYSPPVATVEDCQSMQKQAADYYSRVRVVCVQVRMVVQK